MQTLASSLQRSACSFSVRAVQGEQGTASTASSPTSGMKSGLWVPTKTETCTLKYFKLMKTTYKIVGLRTSCKNYTVMYELQL